MKSQKLEKKLNLTKTTISHLETEDLNQVRGGFTKETLCPMTCYTCNVDCL